MKLTITAYSKKKWRWIILTAYSKNSDIYIYHLAKILTLVLTAKSQKYENLTLTAYNLAQTDYFYPGKSSGISSVTANSETIDIDSAKMRYIDTYTKSWHTSNMRFIELYKAWPFNL